MCWTRDRHPRCVQLEEPGLVGDPPLTVRPTVSPSLSSYAKRGAGGRRASAGYDGVAGEAKLRSRESRERPRARLIITRMSRYDLRRLAVAFGMTAILAAIPPALFFIVGPSRRALMIMALSSVASTAVGYVIVPRLASLAPRPR